MTESPCGSNQPERVFGAAATLIRLRLRRIPREKGNTTAVGDCAFFLPPLRAVGVRAEVASRHCVGD